MLRIVNVSYIIQYSSIRILYKGVHMT